MGLSSLAVVESKLKLVRACRGCDKEEDGEDRRGWEGAG